MHKSLKEKKIGNRLFPVTMNKPLKKEKRIDKRLLHSASLNYTVTGDFIQPPNIITVRGRMLDISNTGIRFQLYEKPPKKGGILCIRIEVNFANATVTVPVMVEVRWVKEVSVNNYYVGSRFML